MNKQATDFIAEKTAEDFFNYIQKHPGKLKPTGKYELKWLANDAARQCDINLTRTIRQYIETH